MGSSLFKKFYRDNLQPFEVSRKVHVALLAHVYAQTNMALLTSIFCAAIVYMGLSYTNYQYQGALHLWLTFVLSIIICRAILVKCYEHEKIPAKKIIFWRRLYIIGATLSGIGWGLAGLILMPYSTPVQQMLMVLMLAGVTAGAIPLLSAIPAAALLFLTFAIPPYIYSIANHEVEIHFLFSAALALYFVYTIMLVINSARLLKQSMILKYENDKLLLNISDAKNQLEIINKKLEEAATHDPLTKISNRNLFHLNLQGAMEKAKASKKSFALLYIDLDHFKQANDSFGHHAGDQILVVITGRLVQLLGDDSNISRLGGDEFSILIEGVDEMKHVDEVAKKICNLVTMPIQINESLNLTVGVSIGISVYPQDGYDAESLLRAADKAMYVAKQRGGCHHHFHAMESVDTYHQ